MHRATARRQDAVYSNSPFRPNPLEKQFALAAEHLPWLDLEGTRRYADTLAGATPFFGSEGFYVLPKWQKVADNRLTATRRVVTLLREHYSCDEWGESALTRPSYEDRTIRTLDTLADYQGRKNSALVVSAQLGHFHANRSVEIVRKELFQKEFGLGLFEVACMLIMNPGRLKLEGNLSIDCAGDNCNPGLGPDSECAPFCRINSDAELELLARPVHLTSLKHGSATGFSD